MLLATGPMAITGRELLGAVLRHHRGLARTTQADLARHLKITSSTWSRIETGKTDLTVSQLRDVGAALGVSSLRLLNDALDAREAMASRCPWITFVDESDLAAWRLGPRAAQALVGELLAVDQGLRAG